MNVLIIRTDRLGDAILASPTWQALKEEFPEASITFLTRRLYLPLFENDPHLDTVLALPEGSGWEINDLARQLNSVRYDAILALYVDKAVARLVRKISAPVKAGPVSKPRTWFLFNRPFRQNRSASILHEADYNGLLLEAIGGTYRFQRPRIHLSAEQEVREDNLLTRIFGDRAGTPYIVVHPGMGGSAVNWPAKRYAGLVQMLLREQRENVVVTGTRADQSYLGSILAQSHPRLFDTVGRLDLIELALLLRRATVFVGPSTGPMHLSTALNTPVVALFSPLRGQHPRRWGPYHTGGTVLVPPVTCRGGYRCRDRRCPDFECLDRISVGEVLAAVRKWTDSPE